MSNPCLLYKLRFRPYHFVIIPRGEKIPPEEIKLALETLNKDKKKPNIIILVLSPIIHSFGHKVDTALIDLIM